jgi:hypothetical protein
LWTGKAFRAVFDEECKITMLAQNMLATNGGQGDLPWAFASLQTPYIRAALPPTKMSHAPLFYAPDFLYGPRAHDSSGLKFKLAHYR